MGCHHKHDIISAALRPGVVEQLHVCPGRESAASARPSLGHQLSAAIHTSGTGKGRGVGHVGHDKYAICNGGKPCLITVRFSAGDEDDGVLLILSG